MKKSTKKSYKIDWEKYDVGKYLRTYVGTYGNSELLQFGNIGFPISDLYDINNTLNSLMTKSHNVRDFAFNSTGYDQKDSFSEKDETIFQKAKQAIGRGTIVAGVAFGKLCLKIAGTALRIGGNMALGMARNAEILSLGLINVIPGLSRDIKEHEKTQISYSHRTTVHLGLNEGKTPAEHIKDAITGNHSSEERTSRVRSAGYHLANAGVALQKLSNQTWAPAKPNKKSKGRSDSFVI